MVSRSRMHQIMAPLVICIGVLLLACAPSCQARSLSAKHYPVERGPGYYKAVWEVNEWVVDFKRPTCDNDTTPIKRLSPFQMNDLPNLGNKYLVNGQYPGPAVEVVEGDLVEITIVNHLGSAATTFHWHGQYQRGTPYMDGTRSVSQAGILPGTNFTYRFVAAPHGTFYWHAHMDAVQSAKGLKGAFIVQPKQNPFKNRAPTAYDSDLLVVVSDEWKVPDVCLRLEGAMAGNDVCGDIRDVSFNGVIGDGTPAYPYALVPVTSGKCYRMRFIFQGSNTENLIVSIAGHNMTLLAIDGDDVQPIEVVSFNMHLGERYDVRVCADQPLGNYLITATYDYACSLVQGNFIPPGFSAVPACSFYSFLSYAGHTGVPVAPTNRSQAPAGTGGGLLPAPTSGVDFDLTNFVSWQQTQPLVPNPQAPEPDARYVLNMGLQGPVYNSPANTPMTMGRWYMSRLEDGPRPYNEPASPLLQTKGECGANNTNLINVPENARVIEVIINNLSPTAHVLHLHGQHFSVINFANYDWCNVNRTFCFLMPPWLSPCPRESQHYGDPAHPDLELGLYWGCAYNNRTDPPTQNLVSPLRKDMLQVWQRSWAVIRITLDNPGMWPFHCHMEQHIPLGMSVVFNVLPSLQPVIPPSVPTSGPCTRAVEVDEVAALRRQRDELLATVAELKSVQREP